MAVGVGGTIDDEFPDTRESVIAVLRRAPRSIANARPDSARTVGQRPP
jgi:hypothetical protein